MAVEDRRGKNVLQLHHQTSVPSVLQELSGPSWSAAAQILLPLLPHPWGQLLLLVPCAFGLPALFAQMVQALIVPLASVEEMAEQNIELRIVISMCMTRRKL